MSLVSPRPDGSKPTTARGAAPKARGPAGKSQDMFEWEEYTERASYARIVVIEAYRCDDHELFGLQRLGKNLPNA